MHILTNERWESGYLDEWLPPRHFRIRPEYWLVHSRIDGLYFERKSDLRQVAAYIGSIGLRSTLRKVRSRRLERHRNEKYLVTGVGTILANNDTAGTAKSRVFFVAPAVQRCQERVVLHESLVTTQLGSAIASIPLVQPGSIFTGSDADGYDGSVERAEGWRHDAGLAPVASDVQEMLLARLSAWLKHGRMEEHTFQPSEVTERSPGRPQKRAAAGSISIAVIGFGNYVKTVVLPSLDRAVLVDCIHELDPAQIGPVLGEGLGRSVLDRSTTTWDTAPSLRRNEGPYDGVIVAGYHHTHAPIAAAALETGAKVLVEKPLATTRGDLDVLRDSSEMHPGRLFVGFNRRHSKFTAAMLSDLSVRPGDAISYFATVYEVGLPRRHWYRWPSSRSRLVSNGCHWIDHFLFLNHCSRVVYEDVRAWRDDIRVELGLDNGAFFCMVLTDRGSSRTGLRNIIEVRTEGAMARVIDDERYMAETATQVRRLTARRLESHRNMYRNYCQFLWQVAGAEESPALFRSSEVTLALDERL